MAEAFGADARSWSAEVAMEDWLTAYKIPLGKWIAGFVDLLNEHAAFAFNAISDGLGFLIDGLIELMQAFPPLVLVASVRGARLLAAPLGRAWSPWSWSRCC